MLLTGITPTMTHVLLIRLTSSRSGVNSTSFHRTSIGGCSCCSCRGSSVIAVTVRLAFGGLYCEHCTFECIGSVTGNLASVRGVGIDESDVAVTERDVTVTSGPAAE